MREGGNREMIGLGMYEKSVQRNSRRK